MTKISLIGPSAPFRGGISQHLTLFDMHLRQSGFDVLLVSFKRQYPRILFGRDDVDSAYQPFHNKTEYLIDSLNPLTWWMAAKRVSNWRPDAVIIPWWTPFWAPIWFTIGTVLKKLSPKTKLIFLCHNVLPHESRVFDKFALNLTLALANGFIVHSQAEHLKLKGLFSRVPILVSELPTYADIGNTGMSLEIKRPAAENILLFCGIVRHYKGLDILLTAMSLISTKVHLCVVGDFWEDEVAYKQKIIDLGLTENVTVLNQYVSDTVLSEYIKLSNAVVLPYRSATQSAVAQLALGHRTPVIATDVGGLPEVVLNKSTGLIVPPENPEQLAIAIDYFFENPEGINYEENIEEDQKRFSWENFVSNVSRFLADQS